MRVLFISNHSQLSGWSLQACNHILALDSVGIDIIPRNIKILNNENPDLHPRIKELEKKDDNNPDIIIFNTLPSYYEKTTTKCLGYFVCETSNFRASDWPLHMNLMDALACPCYHNKRAAIDSRVTRPIHIIPEAIDLDKYSKSYPVHSFRQNNPDKFIFLTISEWTERKNIEAIIKAFHLEFSPNEPVELLIKTTPTGFTNPQQEINSKLEYIKKGLKLYKNIEIYKKENIICGFLNEAEMASIMISSDAYVNASRGEAFCIPVVDAMGFGKVVISPNHTGMDYITDKNAYVIDSIEQPCFNANDTLEDLYTGREYWQEVRIQALCGAMRSAFEKRSFNLKKIQEGRKTVQKFSYENVGNIYKKVLESII